MEPGLAHKGEQAHGFQGHGLSPCVGPSDDQQVKFPAQVDIDGNYLGRVQQGMASFFDVDISVGVENRLAALVMSGQPGPGKDKIQGGQKLLVKADLLRKGRGLVA